MNRNRKGRPGLALNNRRRGLSPVVGLIALALLGFITAACAENPAVTAPPATPTAVPTPLPATPTAVPTPLLATPTAVPTLLPATPTAVPTPPPATPTAVPTPLPATPTAVPTPLPAPARPEAEPPLATHLYALESKSVRLERFDGRGGAIESLGEDLLVVTPKGRFALVARDGTVEYLDGSVPMNYAALQSIPASEQIDFEPSVFRVADILLQETAGGYTLFVTHHYFTGECIRFRLSATTIRRDAAGITVSPDWRTVFDAEPCLLLLSFGGAQAGGKMLTDGADHLLVIIGTHASIWSARPTFDPDRHLGKLLRIAIATGESEALAIGLRNPQGLARDGAGNLWATDHGPQGGDELNLLEPGGNYGWPLVSYGIEYGGTVPPTVEDAAVGQHDSYRRPVFSWVPSPAVSAIAVNDGRQFPLWKDDLLVASLPAHSLYRVRRHGTVVQYVEQIELGYRIRDLTFMPDGRIALLRDGGWVYFLSRSEGYCNEAARARRDVYAVNCASFAPAPARDTAYAGPAAPSFIRDLGRYTTAGAQLYGQHCSVCHNQNAERHDAGPHLVGLLERPAGQVEGYRFSPAFDSLGVVWTPDRLTEFLTDPEQVAPGTTMAAPDLRGVEARAIANYLSSLSYLERLAQDSEPVVRSDFDLYLRDHTLTYVKKPCALADTEGVFYLYLYPVAVADLPDDRRQHGFDYLDFRFGWHGGVFDGKCMATAALPEYAISRIITGQYVSGQGQIWEEEFPFNGAE